METIHVLLVLLIAKVCRNSLDSQQFCKVADSYLRSPGNVSDGSYFLNFLLLIPHELGEGDTGMVEPTYPEEEAVITFRTGGSQGEVVCPPDAVYSFVLVRTNFRVV